jgi:hypothetical protein
MVISSMEHGTVTSNTRAKKWTKFYYYKDYGLLQQKLLIQLSFVAIKCYNTTKFLGRAIGATYCTDLA